MSIVHHIALNCRDRKKQEAFYTRHFGFRRSRVFNEGTPNEFVMLRLGPTCVELFSAKEEDRTRSGGAQPVGFNHLAFEVADMEEATTRLRDDGIETDKIIDCSNVVEGLRVCFFDDPEGNRIELMQGYADQFTE